MTTRVLRSTIYLTPDQPLTTVVRDCDVIDTLESIRAQAPPVEALVVYEIFTMEGEASVEVATVEAERHRCEAGELERWKSIGYEYNVYLLTFVRAHGVVVNPEPAPYGVEDATDVAKQLVNHSLYDHQTFMMTTNDNKVVVMKDGKVTVEDSRQ